MIELNIKEDQWVKLNSNAVQLLEQFKNARIKELEQQILDIKNKIEITKNIGLLDVLGQSSVYYNIIPFELAGRMAKHDINNGIFYHQPSGRWYTAKSRGGGGVGLVFIDPPKIEKMLIQKVNIMMNIFISPNYAETDSGKEIIKISKNRNYTINIITGSFDPTVYNDHIQKRFIVYGEQHYCEFIAQELRLNLIQNSPDWIANIPNTFTKRQIAYMTIGDAKKLQSNDASILGKKELSPADGALFNVGIYPQFPTAPNNTPILVSRPIKWLLKYRFIIHNGKIVNGCCYQAGEDFNNPQIYKCLSAYKNVYPDVFLQDLLDTVRCAPGAIIDVGMCEYGWAIIQSIPIWSAELYGCDPNHFLNAIKIACRTPIKTN